MPNCVTFLPPLQPHHACVFEHENVHAFLVSVTVFRLIWIYSVVVMYSVSPLVFFFLLLYRFDIYGLSPDANEDEAGIKRASENSTSIHIFVD